MFYATREIVIERGEKVTAGSPLPTAPSWSEPVRRALVYRGWIEERPDAPVEQVATPKKPQRGKSGPRRK